MRPRYKALKRLQDLFEKGDVFERYGSTNYLTENSHGRIIMSKNSIEHLCSTGYLEVITTPYTPPSDITSVGFGG